MWELYDELIEGIDPSATADKIIRGAYQTLVISGEGYGICNTMDDTWRPSVLPSKSLGMPLRDLAACVKSWNFSEASIGLAALNAWYNEKSRLKASGVEVSDLRHTEDRTNDPFITYQRDVRGKTVTVVGHFPYIEQLFAPVCTLRIIEKFMPKDGDYPEQAAEYLLPESDFVFISSYTFVEKQLPRYLELSRGAKVTLVGPATTMAPQLARYGIADLSGFVVKDFPAAERVALGLAGENFHSLGQKISMRF
jgi:uncharacterized protein (DUF4213/DUF364 family)